MQRLWLLCLILAILCGHVHPLSAQITVRGTVRDSLGKPLVSASISLVKQRTGLVLSYGVTDANGHYQLQHAQAKLTDTLAVQAGMIGYYRQVIVLKGQVVDFKLQAAPERLPDVAVTNNKAMVRMVGDTLNFAVSAFARPQDRVIGDIIKRLPGVEVDDDGKIKYQGKEINRFYIDGDNLLDGKYNIASKGIPADMVDKIQVLENHQPVKALQHIDFSDKPAMNITLKDNARLKLTGTGDVGVGLPGLYQGKANLMLFKKQFKFINYYKLNNIGIDLSNELLSHFSGDNDPAPSPLLRIGSDRPPLTRNRYLLNQTGLLNANNLIKLASELQLRVNASYLFNREFQVTKSKVDFFLPNDTIHFSERIHNESNARSLNTQFTITANKTKYYLNNVLIIDNTPQGTMGNLQSTGNSDIHQQLSGTVTNISNELRYTKVMPGKKYILDVYSYLNHIRNPATLQVQPGLYANVFNNNNAYAGLIQEAAIPTFMAHHYLSLKIAGKLNQSYRVGVDYQDQDINSQLYVQETNGLSRPVADSFMNRFAWKRVKLYARADYHYVIRKAIFTLSIPITHFDIRYTGKLPDKQIRSMPVTPQAYIKLTGNKETSYTFSHGYSNNWGGVANVYDGYLMQSYRGFITNAGILPQRKMQYTSFAFEKKNTMKVFFLNASILYAVNTTNVITDNRYTTVIQQSRAIEFDNVTESKRFNLALSKYLFGMKSTVGAKFLFQQDGSNQLLNQQLLRYRTSVTSWETSISTQLNSWSNTHYSIKSNGIKTRQTNSSPGKSAPTQTVQNTIHRFDVHVSFSNQLLWKAGGEYYCSTAPGRTDNRFLFLDMSMVYKWDQLKTDIDLSITNIGGSDQYSIVSVTANNLVERTFQIRPRMMMLKMLYRF